MSIGFKLTDNKESLVHTIAKLVLTSQVIPFKNTPASKEFSSKSCRRKVEFNHGVMIPYSELQQTQNINLNVLRLHSLLLFLDTLLSFRLIGQILVEGATFLSS